jgi:TolB-like protein/DNA-binding winged helix-turn-helix (wHTH) protein/Flp pilus assembly protein TadD
VPEPLRFGEFDLDVDRYELRRSGRTVKLERIPMELLILLLQNEGKLVRREAINRRLWGENALQDTEHSVNTAVNKLRFILRDDPREPRFIQTVVGQGYRFIAKVAVGPDPVVPAAVVREREEDHQSPAAHNGSSPGPERRAAEASIPQVLPSESLPPALPIENLVHEKKPVPAARRRRLAFLAGLVLVAALLTAAAVRLRDWQRVQLPTSVAGGFHSIAVLPFINLAPNADQDYIVDGMTDQLITDLASSTALRVISRSSMMQYKGKQVPMWEIAHALNVDAVLEGSFLHTGTQVRITANLIDARNDRHLWAQVYEESGSDLLSMQEQVTNDIVREVALALGSGVTTSRLRPVNVTAREAYLRGRFLWNKRTLDSMEKAIEYYQKAIKADPDFAEAYAAMGDAYVLLSSYGGEGPSTALEKAEEAARHALRLGGGLAEAHTVLGAVRTDRDWDWSAAEAEYRQALKLNPSYPTARHWYSLHLSRLGRTQEAEAEIQRARALDPLSLIIATDAAETAYWARKPDEARKRIDEVLLRNPDFAEAHLVSGKIYEQQGHYEQALHDFKSALMLFGGGTNVEALQAHALALAGAPGPAIEIVRHLETRSPHSYLSGVDVAAIYCALRQPDAAIRWLNRAYVNRDKGVDILGIDPLFDGCRSDTRFQTLMATLKLKPAAKPGSAEFTLGSTRSAPDGKKYD